MKYMIYQKVINNVDKRRGKGIESTSKGVRVGLILNKAVRIGILRS